MSYNFSSEVIDEIVYNILKRLPTESLTRFKCISKFWNYAISHPNLLQKQICLVFGCDEETGTRTLHSVDNTSLILKHRLPRCRRRSPWGDTQNEVYSSWEDTENEDNSSWEDNVSEGFYHHEAYFVTNSCHGLVVIGLNTSLYLFNPSNNFFIKVLQLDILYDDGYRVTGGFCYDDSTNDYKVVLIFVHKCPDYGGEFDYFHKFVRVVSLKSKRRNNIYSAGFNLGSAIIGPVVNGRMHCTASPSSSFGARTVFHFDHRSEIFENLLMPKNKNTDEEDFVVGLGVLNDQLVMCRRGEMGSNNKCESIEVMVMKEYGVAESWTTLFVVSNVDLMVNPFYENLTVNPFYEILIPLIFAKNGEVIVNAGHRGVILYNPITRSYKNVKFLDKSSVNAMVCLDVSLVAPKGLKWDSRKYRRLRKRNPLISYW